MSYEKQIEKHLKNSGGIITSAYCRKNNIPTVYLSRLFKEGKLSKIKKGIYITEEGDYDEYFFFNINIKKLFFLMKLLFIF